MVTYQTLEKYIYISKEIGVEYLIEYLIQEFYPPV